MMHETQKTEVIELDFDIQAVRREFPMLNQNRAGEAQLVYLDSAATSLKPRAVIDSVVEFYEHYTANVSRGVHALGEKAGQEFEDSRQTIANFINADFDEVIFVRNCTEGINLVAENLNPQSHVICSDAEHHSNLLPWTRFENCSKVNIGSDGTIDLNHLRSVCDRDRPELIAFALISNALGTIQPWEQITNIARSVGAKVLIDASQWVSHRVTDVAELDCDFLCFSGHKMCGPSGIGVLYGRRELLSEFSCGSLGGGMVTDVQIDGHVLQQLPFRLEAGTPNIEGAIGLAAACRYLDSRGLENIHRHVSDLTEYCLDRLGRIPEISIIGPRDIDRRGGIVSFCVDNIEANGVAKVLSDRFNIMARSGYHCAQPAHETLGLRPTVRVSFSLYNTKHEIDCLAEALVTICSKI